MLRLPSIRAFRAVLKRSFSVEVKMPSLSPTMTSGTIVKWNKKEGEEISPGDVLCEIQTDKAVVSMEVDDEGVLAKIIVNEGSADISVGSLIGVIAEAGEEWEKVREQAPSASAPPEAAAEKLETKPPPAEKAERAPPPKQTVAAAESRPRAEEGRLIGPAVRLLLQLYNVQWSDVKATGRDGILLKHDVVQHIKSHALVPAVQEESLPEASVGDAQPTSRAGGLFPAKMTPSGRSSATRHTDLPLSSEATALGRDLVQAKLSIPHAFATATVDLSEACQFAESPSDLIVKAAIAATRVIPITNPSAQISVRTYNPSTGSFDSALVKNGVSERAAQPCGDTRILIGQGIGLVIIDYTGSSVTQATTALHHGETAVLCIGCSADNRAEITLSYNNALVDEKDAQTYVEAVRSMASDPDLLLLGGQPGDASALQERSLFELL